MEFRSPFRLIQKSDPRGFRFMKRPPSGFTGFDLEPQATVTLAQSSGPIQIQVKSSLIWRGTETVSSGSVVGFTLAYFGTAAVTFEAPFTGVLVAPSAQITLGTDTSLTFAGQFYVSGLVATPNTVIVCREDMLP